MLSASSIVSLIQRLVRGAEWHQVYEVLLNLNGKTSRTQVTRDLPSYREYCLDIALSLRLCGRIESAAKLQQLSNEFGDADPMLYILAQLARNPTAPKCNGRSMFPLNPTSNFCTKQTKSNVFSFNDNSDAAKSTIDSSPNIDNLDFMSNAARRLLQSEHIIREPDEVIRKVERRKTGERTQSPRNNLALRRNKSLTRFTSLRQESVADYPRQVVELLFYLFCSSTDSIQAYREPSRTPSTPSNIEPISLLANRIPFSTCRDLEEQSVNRAKFCGELYARLACFSLAYSRSPGRTLLAVAQFAGNLSDEYQKRILAVLDKKGNTTSSMYWDILFAAEKFIEDAIIVCELLEEIEHTNGLASAVLDVLNQALRVHRNVKIVNRLFYSAFSPYLEMVLDWVLYASSSRDSGCEFFGTVLGKRITDAETLACTDEAIDNLPTGVYPAMFGKDTSLFILRSGRSRALLETISGKHHLLELSAIPVLRPLSCEKLLTLSNWLKHPPSMTEKDTNSSKPSYTDNEVDAQSVYFDGLNSPSSQISRETTSSCVPGPHNLAQVFCSPRDCYQDSKITRSRNLFCVPDATEESSLEATEIVLEPAPSSIFNDVVVENLKIVDEKVQREIFSFFVEKIRVFDHLKLLSDFGLLGAGNFADVFVDHMNEAEQKTIENERFITRRVNAAKTFYGSSGGGGFALRKQRHILESLRNALNSVGRTDEDLIELFSIGTGQWETNDSSLWNTSFEIEYEATFPLTMIITPDALMLYSKLFNFFLSVHRARKSLRSLYLRTRRPRNKFTTGPWASNEMYRRLWSTIWQFSWHADHFVSVVGGYQFNQLHRVARYEFETSCRKISNIWELSQLHMTFLSDACRRVLLDERQPSLMRVIKAAFQVIFDVEREISTLQDNIGHFPKVTWQRIIDKLESATEHLRKSAKFFIHILEELVSTGTYLELSDFLTRLNFNKFYSGSDDDVQ